MRLTSNGDFAHLSLSGCAKVADYGFGTTIEGRSDLVQINVLWLSNCLWWKDSLVDIVKQLRLFFPLLVLSLDKLIIKDLL